MLRATMVFGQQPGERGGDKQRARHRPGDDADERRCCEETRPRDCAGLLASAYFFFPRERSRPVSSPNEGSLRVPVTLMGIAAPRPLGRTMG